MSQNQFPDFRTMPIFEKALRELIGISQNYVNELSPFCNHGDIQIFCQIISTVLINGLKDYIDSLRLENNDPVSYGLSCYKQCVDMVIQQITDPMILSVFENPPEEWINNTINE